MPRPPRRRVSSSASTGCTMRTTNGSVTNRKATNTAGRVLTMSTPTGLSGPYSDSSTSPATIVGSANGMSMSTSRARLPKNWSRTRTHAISVPMTTLTTVTSSAWVTVSRMAAAVCSLVIVCQNPLQPPSVAVTTTAASGISTSTLNQSSAIAEPDARCGRQVAGAARPTPTRRPLRDGERPPSLALPRLGDRQGDDAVLLVEELLRQRRPALEVLGDGQQVLDGRVRVGGVVGPLDLAVVDAVDDRPEALAGRTRAARRR